MTITTTTDSGGFVTKQQFQAVFEHFEQVVSGSAEDAATLHREFRLLLEYFRAMYSDSERRSHKVLQLTSLVAKNDRVMEQLQRARERENLYMSEQVRDTTAKIDELVRKEHALLQQVDTMKAVITRLRSIYEEEGEEFEGESKRGKDGEENCEDRGVMTEPQEEPREGWRECELCCTRSEEAVNQLLNAIGRDEEHEREAADMRLQGNILATRLEIACKERDELKALDREHELLFEDLRVRLKQGEERIAGEETLQVERESLKATVDKLVRELSAKRCEIRDLQEALDCEIMRRGEGLLENRAKDAELAAVKKRLIAEQEAHETTLRNANLFEEHLATDQERRVYLENQLAALHTEVEVQGIELREGELLQRTLLSQGKASELSHRGDLMELQRTIETLKVQAAFNDKKIEAMTMKQEETEMQLGIARKNLKEKDKAHSTLTNEISKLKTNSSTMSAQLQTTRYRLEALKNVFQKHKAEMNAMRHRNGMLMREKNLFYCRYRELDAKMASQKRNSMLLTKDRDHHRRALEDIDKEVERLAKKEKVKPTFRY